MKCETYKYLFGADHYLIVDAYVTEPVTSSLCRAAEDDNEPCDAECEIDSITLNGVEFEADGIYLASGNDIFGKPVYRDLTVDIQDKILMGECEYV